jgi:hypothetical protein
MHASASRWLALLAVLLWCAAPADAAADPVADTAADPAADPAALIERCLPRLDAARDVGVARILQRCPELEPAWTRDPGAFGLPLAWRELGSELSVDSLRELSPLLRAADQSAAAPPRGAEPSAATLGAVLADWSLPDDAGLLQRLLRWIRARVGADDRPLEPDAAQAAQQDAQRLARLWPLLGWLGFAATLGLVAWVLAREARAAGWGAAGRWARTRPADADDRSAAVATSGADTRERDVAAQRPEWWLAQLAARLAARGALRHPAAATAREIAAAATVGPVGLQQLGLLTEVAEAARYAPHPPAPARLEAAAAAGAALLEELR